MEMLIFEIIETLLLSMDFEFITQHIHFNGMSLSMASCKRHTSSEAEAHLHNVARIAYSHSSTSMELDDETTKSISLPFDYHVSELQNRCGQQLGNCNNFNAIDGQ